MESKREKELPKALQTIFSENKVNIMQNTKPKRR